MMLVLDASAAVHALLRRNGTLWERLTTSRCHAPHLIDAEVGSVLRRSVRAGDVRADTAAGALHALGSLVSERYPHGPLGAGAWALRDNVSYYDALYVALATRLQVPLLTLDARLARTPGLTCAVEVVS